MPILLNLRCISLFTVFIPSYLAIAQTVAPYPFHTCASAVDTAWGGNVNQCCADGTSCCAGGCCPLIANCINSGTANEACSPFPDPTACGSNSAVSVRLSVFTTLVCCYTDGQGILYHANLNKRINYPCLLEKEYHTLRHTTA